MAPKIKKDRHPVLIEITEGEWKRLNAMAKRANNKAKPIAELILKRALNSAEAFETEQA